ncbi:hypothetical protein ACFLTH_04730 [Bacteroidota bacterium]
MSNEQKTFFQTPTPGEIKKLEKIIEIKDDFVHRILEMDENTGGIITSEIIPSADFKDSKTFMKYAPRVELRKLYNLNEAKGVRPLDLRREAFEEIKKGKDNKFAGYTDSPFQGDDTRPRKFSLTECLEGARIFAYVYQEPENENLFRPIITIKPYDDENIKGVTQNGAVIEMQIPSRTKNPRHKFNLVGVPVYDSNQRWSFIHSLDTTHICESKFYHIRYVEEGKGNPKEVNFCAHEVAGYFEIMAHYHKPENNINIIPAQMNPFAIPTQFTVDFYNMNLHNILIKTPDERAARPLHKAEKEILLWGLVREFGHDKTFYASTKEIVSKRKSKGKLMVKDYNWRK